MSKSGKGRFSDRIKKIKLFKKKRNKFTEEEKPKNKFLIKSIGVIGSFIFERENNEIDNKEHRIIDNKFKNNYLNSSKLIDNKFRNNVVNNNKINIYNKEASISHVKTYNKELSNKNFKEVISMLEEVEKKEEVSVTSEDNISSKKEVDKSIILEKAKELLEETQHKLLISIDELEILESELYVLSKVNDDELTLKKCKEHIDKINEILDKIEEQKKKFEYLKKDYDFEYLIKADKSNILTHEAIEINNIFANRDMAPEIKEYKLLDLYKELYIEVNKIDDDINKLEEEKKKQIKDLEKRNIDFEELKKMVYEKETKNLDLEAFIKRQEDIFNNLNNKIAKIDSHEVIEYKFKGFDELLRSYFKYSFLFLISPLKGLIPSIGRETLITKNVIKNLKNNVGMEKQIKIVYEATDYSSELGDALYDLKYVDNLVNNTLEDIYSLKKKYKDKFMEYEDTFLEYKEVMKKIELMEKRLLSNKRKIDIMKEKVKIKEKENTKTLKLVKDLNQNKE